MPLFARRYDTSTPVAFEIAQGRLLRCEPLREADAAATLPWLTPGWVDLQVNGYGGVEFSSPDLTVEKVRAVVTQMRAQGAVRFLPTVTTQAAEVILAALRTIATACDTDSFIARHAVGIHLEGPYISAADGPRGAHRREFCRPPDWSEFEQFQQASGNRIRLVTLSPEYAESIEFIRRAKQAGVVVSIGHTQATGDQIQAAVDAGAALSTHLGNGSHGVLRRHPNYLWDQLAADRLAASFIADGHHLPPEVVQTFVRAKGIERCILVSDLSGMAGLPPGHYQTDLCELDLLADGRLVLAGQDQLLAGASQPLSVGIENVMRFAAVDFQSAIAMASLHPARLLGLACPTFTPGEPADYLLVRRGEAATGARIQIEAILDG
ncbi:MAG TPA: amidohydrolase family protein [Pirellulales bacterium]|jgi:N-acetylglucosamine-6-phosphate deacetylase|nr:amidohydrolase family protein [Pirellulales bacterium]